MKKSAKEMFEELDYKLINNRINLLKYRNNDGGFIKEISFSSYRKHIDFKEYEEYNNNQPQGTFRIDCDLLKAINKQREELGWE